MGIKLGNGKWATKEDELLAYRVIEGKYFDRSFDFARSSTTTRVNKDGYIEVVPSDTARIDFADSVDGALLTEPASTNLITYPISFGNNYWTKSGASIQGDPSTAGSELVTNGDFATDSDWGGSGSISGGQLTKTSGGLAYQSVVITSGTQYKIVVDVESLDGTTNIYAGGNNSEALSVGVQTIYMTGGSSNDWLGLNNGYSVGVGSVFNSISVKEVQGFESPKVDGSGGFEREAYKLVESSGGTTHNTYVAIGGLTSGTGYSISAFVKAGERSKVAIKDGAGASYAAAFDLSTGTLLWEGYTGISSITALANGWYKISVVSSQASTTRYPMIVLLSNSYTTASYFDYSGDGTSGIYIAYAQLEEQASATSLMLPTTEGSTTSRVADACTGSGTAQDFKDYNASGVLYAEIAANSDDLTDRYITIGDGGTSNRVEIRYRSASNQIYVAVRVGGTYVSTMSYFVSDITDFHKVALKWNTDDFALWVDGVERVTDNSGVTFSAGTLSNMSLAGTPSGGADFYGKTKAVEVLPYMSDTEMSLLTSP